MPSAARRRGQKRVGRSRTARGGAADEMGSDDAGADQRRLEDDRGGKVQPRRILSMDAPLAPARSSRHVAEEKRSTRGTRPDRPAALGRFCGLRGLACGWWDRHREPEASYEHGMAAPTLRELGKGRIADTGRRVAGRTRGAPRCPAVWRRQVVVDRVAPWIASPGAPADSSASANRRRPAWRQPAPRRTTADQWSSPAPASTSAEQSQLEATPAAAPARSRAERRRVGKASKCTSRQSRAHPRAVDRAGASSPTLRAATQRTRRAGSRATRRHVPRGGGPGTTRSRTGKAQSRAPRHVEAGSRETGAQVHMRRSSERASRRVSRRRGERAGSIGRLSILSLERHANPLPVALLDRLSHLKPR